MPKIKSVYSDSAMENLVLASRAARSGDSRLAREHFSRADKAIKDHVDWLKRTGNSHEADSVQNAYSNQKKMMISALKVKIKPVSAKQKAKKSESGLNQIGNGIFLKAEKISTKMKLGQTANPRYEYKGLHELHPEDRHRVLGRAGRPMYAGTEHHRYLYPTDQSGRIVHSGRIVAPSGHDLAAAKASMESSETKQPKHAEGQGVRVDQPGHQLHGKFGVVQTPHPLYPDKINVLFSGGKREFFDASAVKPNIQRSPVDKAKSAVVDIRSRLKSKK